MAAYSADLRLRIFNARRDGETTEEVAERFDVCTAFVRRLLQRHRETGSLAPKSGTRGPKPKLAGCDERLREYNARNPDRTPAEARLALGLTASVSTVRRAFVRLGLTRKKSRRTPRSASAPT